MATISCLAEGTEIYYYITDTSSTVKPDKDTWTKYEGPVSVLFDNEKGGSKYLWAATTTDDGENWLKSAGMQPLMQTAIIHSRRKCNLLFYKRHLCRFCIWNSAGKGRR